MASNNDYDAILMDVHMPGMNASLGKPWQVEELEKELQNLLNLS